MTTGAVTMETIRLEREGDVLTVVIDHPRSAMNAVDATLHRELAELLTALGHEHTIAETNRHYTGLSGADFIAAIERRIGTL